MKHKITDKIRRSVEHLARLAAAVEERLDRASPEVRSDWKAMRLLWPSEIELRQGLSSLSDDELAIMESKARRFHDILGGPIVALGPVETTDSHGRPSTAELKGTSDG